MRGENRGRPKLFLVAAVYNWVVALALGLFHDPLLSALQAPPLTHPAALELFAALAFVFGIGYFRAYLDPAQNRPIIVLGIQGKLAVFLVCAAHYLAGDLPGAMFLGGVGDVVFAGLFMRYLQKN